MPGGFRTARLDELPPVADHGLDVDAAWKPVRHHLGVGAFGINAYVADAAGDVVIEEHDEGDDYGHEELYVVHAGRARFTVGGERIDAPAGTFVFVEDPHLTRAAVAEEPGTAVIAVGARRGAVFEPSEWETRRTAELPPAGR